MTANPVDTSAPSGLTARGAMRGAAPWLAIAVLHVTLYQWLAETDRAYLALFLPFLMTVLADWRRLIPKPLFFCHVSAVTYLAAEPSMALGALVFFAIFFQLKVIADERRLLVLAAQGLWTGWVIASGIYAWIVPSIQAFFGGGVAGALPLYMVVTLIIGAQLMVFFVLLRLLWDLTRIPLGLLGPCLYVVVEHFVSLPMGIQLPLAFVFMPMMIQTLELAGIAGTTLLITLVGGCLYEARRAEASRSRQRWLWLSAFALLIPGQLFYGFFRMVEAKKPGPTIEVAMIQPVSPLRVMNSDTALQEETAARLERLSIAAMEPMAGERPDLLFWPEGAAAFAAMTPTFNPPYRQAMDRVLQQTSGTLVIHHIEFRREPVTEKLRYLSAISLVQRDGTIPQTYHKTIPMPFGEYLPMERQFPILRRWFPDARTLLAGNDPRPIDGPGGRFAPLICYEVLFPGYVRQLVQADVTYIVVLTNDRWYGRRQQPPQHLAYAVLRAIENNRPVVRSANSGISALIRETGLIPRGMRIGVEQEDVLRGEIKTQAGARTLYNRWGDWLVWWVLLPGLALVTARALWERRQNRSGRSNST